MNNFAKKSMPTVPVALAFLALGSVAFVPGNLRAQTEEANVLHACYIPHIGLVYRIKEPGLRSKCRRRHVEFSWNEKGPQGDPGPPGPSNGGGFTRTDFTGPCLKDGASGFDIDGFTKDGDIISDATITLADPPILSAYERSDDFNTAGTWQAHRYGDDLFIQEGKIIIACAVGWDYKIVMIQ